MVIERNYDDGTLMFASDLMKIVSFIDQAKEGWAHYKIGKSGNSAQERYAESDYYCTYDGIKVVYSSTSKQLVSQMEASLINYFINDPKCDNSKDGDNSINDTMADSKKYIVYVVYKKRLEV